MRWTNFRVAVGVVVLLLGAIAYISANPLRRPDAEIQARLLRSTPLGTSMPQVRAFIEEKGWKVGVYSETSGFMDGRVHPDVETGAKHIRASLGDYMDVVFPANVTAFWGFDSRGRLIDIWVWRTVDGL